MTGCPGPLPSTTITCNPLLHQPLQALGAICLGFISVCVWQRGLIGMSYVCRADSRICSAAASGPGLGERGVLSFCRGAPPLPLLLYWPLTDSLLLPTPSRSSASRAFIIRTGLPEGARGLRAGPRTGRGASSWQAVCTGPGCGRVPREPVPRQPVLALALR